MIGYKKVVYYWGEPDDYGERKCRYYIAKLSIPSTAQVVGPHRLCSGKHKYRASEAKVLGLFTTTGKPAAKRASAVSMHDISFKYKIGETVKPTLPFDPEGTCGSGIHFFGSFDEAVDW